MEKESVFTRADYESVIEDGDGKIVALGCYHRFGGRDRRIKSGFGEFERMLLDLKQRRVRAVDAFAKALDRVLKKDVVICVVPSHKAEDSNVSGIADVARRVAANGRIDAIDLLIRGRTVDKLSGGGRRDIQVHYDSIVHNDVVDVTGKTVVVLDDIATSGNSLIACRNIVLKCTNAARCIMVAIAQTDRSNYSGPWRRRLEAAREKNAKMPLDRISLEKPYRVYLEEQKRNNNELGPIPSSYFEGILIRHKMSLILSGSTGRKPCII